MGDRRALSGVAIRCYPCSSGVLNVTIHDHRILHVAMHEGPAMVRQTTPGYPCSGQRSRGLTNVPRAAIVNTQPSSASNRTAFRAVSRATP